MIPPALVAEILRLHHVEHWPPHTIARQLRVHHSAVTRIVAQDGLPPSPRLRPSKIDPYLPVLQNLLERFPTVRAPRLYQMLRERGYTGRPDHFRTIVRRYRPVQQNVDAYLRLKTLPGEQGQVDWAHFGKIAIGKALRPLVAFVLVLSYSRAIFLRFMLAQKFAWFLRGHVEAFDRFRGITRVLLYDNLKSAVLERAGDAIRFNAPFLEFAMHHRFEPRPVSVCRGNEKGRVERAIGYVRTSFFAARSFSSLDDLNRQADIWCETIAMERRWPEDAKRTVREAFIEEQPKLLELPVHPYPVEERIETQAGKTPYVRFDLNDYSVPHEIATRPVSVLATPNTVRVLYGTTIVASHARTFDRAQTIEDPAHVEGLKRKKSKARRHAALSRLTISVPSAEVFLVKVAEHGMPLQGVAKKLLDLLNAYGASAMDRAIQEAIEKEVLHVAGVQNILDRELERRRETPPLPLVLPDDPRIHGLTVRAHPLSTYDKIQEVPHASNDPTATS